MKTLVLVLGARVAPYPRMIRTIRSTWASAVTAGVETLVYYGGDALSVDGEDLVVPVPDGPAHIGQKTLAAFEYVLAERDFDVVFRTNCSSYLDLPNLSAYAAREGRPDRFYSGVIGMRGALPFASGSGYFLSRDLVELVVQHRDRWDHKLIDDAALAALLVGHDIHPEPAPRRDYERVADVVNVDTSQFHFRCRTGSWRRLEDDRIMRRLHRAFCAARGLPVTEDDVLSETLWRTARGVASVLGRR